MRRLILEQPYSAAALWSRRLAIFAVAVAVMGFVVARGGLDANAVMAVLGGAVCLAGLAILVSLAAINIIWRTGRKGAGQLAAGLILASLLLAYPAYLAVLAYRLPVLNDISTDIDDPPAFALTRSALAARGGKTPQSISAARRELQKAAYPDVQPIVLDLEADEAYQAVLKAITASGWRIVDTVPPGGRFGIGHVDAIARGRILGFPNDITIRIKPLAGETRIDVRAVSHLGSHDFGANSRRIEQFAELLQAEVDKE